MTTTSSANYNSQTFSNTLDAATNLAQPFISNIADSTKDVYSYDVYSSADMEKNFSISDPVWQYNGPVLGYNNPNQNFVAATDCSGFVARVLSATLPSGSASVYASLITGSDGKIIDFITDQHPQPFPSAEDYADWIVAGTKANLKEITFSAVEGQDFTKSGTFSSVQPGDILAYGLPPGSKDTGHVMIIAGIAELRKGTLNTSAWGSDLTEFTGNGLSFYAVTVFDSSNVKHYNDQRGNAAAGTTGVGLGTVLIITDASGAPIGFMFNVHDMLLQTTPIDTTIAASSVSKIGSLAIGRIV